MARIDRLFDVFKKANENGHIKGNDRWYSSLESVNLANTTISIKSNFDSSNIKSISRKINQTNPIKNGVQWTDFDSSSTFMDDLK